MIDCWTDTRFADAHRLYARLGYERQPEMRDLNDLSNSTEFHFIKQL
jgi:RimJ/RimL family protein N-acetyltransferase